MNVQIASQCFIYVYIFVCVCGSYLQAENLDSTFLNITTYNHKLILLFI